MGYCLKKIQALLISVIFVLLIIGQCFFSGYALAFSVKDEIELGKKFNVLVKSRMPLVQDPEVVQYMDYLIERLSKAMPLQPVPFTPAVVRSPSVNAFATPGGYVFAYSGLILAMDNEAEFAAVMAHELAHVTQRHIARRIENSQAISLLSTLGILAGAFLGGDAGAAAMVGSVAASQAAMLNYSRSDENEADQVGLSYLIKAGYDPYGMPRAFTVLSRRQWILGGSIPTYLSTHPDLKDRILETSIRIDRLPENVRNAKMDNSRFKRIQTILRSRYTDPQGSIIYFNKELTGPGKCLAQMGLGVISSRQNRINDAASYFEDAQKCDPSDQLIVREAGRFHYSKGNRDMGHDLLQKAVAMKKDDLMALFYLSRSQADRGQMDLAIKNLQYVLRFIPEDSEIHFFLARFYGQRQQLFYANLHMAYSSLYQNDKKTVTKFFDAAKELASSPEQSIQISRFENIYKERSQYW